jgi:hypothetical protein
MRHVLSPEERRRGGRNGFRAAVASLQDRYLVNFGTAMKLMRKILSGKGGSK